MESVLLVIHLLIALALVGVILIQRSEGGGLGIGGGNMGGMMSTRGTANLLTRTTGILAGCFMATSLVLAILAGAHKAPTSIIDTMPAQPVAPAAPAQPATPAQPAPPVAQ
ncbi:MULTISPECIES: preprotein translocase subunit SecG [Azospirillum]|uniref:Protein-export membrane protein SecG n=2 Tax=Azospirillum TaxID=191 RepID=A0A235H7F1_AZOBR|nr:MULTISPECIES: preprotein translocase subunit SecG [Azospirillum]OYD81750.1 preprotein translocase subunit SecG [Azospirillum brasilense]